MSPPFPPALVNIAWLSLSVGVACALFIAVDETRRPQSMWIMNLVWPSTALFGSVIWLAFYLRRYRAPTRTGTRRMKAADKSMGDMMPEPPFALAVATGTSHCGAACALDDLFAEWLVFLAVAFGWHSLFADKMFAVWTLYYILAFALDIAFQYFTVTPMRNLSLGAGLPNGRKGPLHLVLCQPPRLFEGCIDSHE